MTDLEPILGLLAISGAVATIAVLRNAARRRLERERRKNERLIAESARRAREDKSRFQPRFQAACVDEAGLFSRIRLFMAEKFSCIKRNLL